MKSMQELCFLAFLATTTSAAANTFTADGTVFEPTHVYTFRGDRSMVPDGSFEYGTCLNMPTWICTTDNACDWIDDLVPLGLWNCDGNHIAWLGGFCGGVPTEHTSICKAMLLETCCPDLPRLLVPR